MNSLLSFFNDRSAMPLITLLLLAVWSFEPRADTTHLFDCKHNCSENTVYKSPVSSLEFSILSSDNANGITSTRHRYQIALTRGKQSLLIFDHLGQRHEFTENEDGQYQAADAKSGSLQHAQLESVWISEPGIKHQFRGSTLTGMHFPDNHRLTLSYKQGRLDKVADEFEQQIAFQYQSGELATVSLPNGQHWMASKGKTEPIGGITFAGPQECKPTDHPTPSNENSPTSESCDLDSNPHTAFQPVPGNLAVNLLDARPKSCTSYFTEFYGTIRGEEIESGIALHPPYDTMIPTVRSFPIVDFINGDQMVVVNSRDLASPTFNDPDNPDALLTRLLNDGKDIKRKFTELLAANGQVSVTELGQTTTINDGDVGSITLQVIIRDGMASSSHWQQMQQARDELLARCGVELQIVVIP